jgi:hypothetical protein
MRCSAAIRLAVPGRLSVRQGPARPPFWRRPMPATRRAGRRGSRCRIPFCVDRHRDDFRKLVAGPMDYVIGNVHEWESLYQTNLDEALRLATADCEHGDLHLLGRSGDPDPGQSAGRSAGPSRGAGRCDRRGRSVRGRADLRAGHRVWIWKRRAAWRSWPRPRSSAMSAPGPSATCWPISRLLALSEAQALLTSQMDIWARSESNFRFGPNIPGSGAAPQP